MKALLLSEKESITVRNDRMVIGNREYSIANLDFTDVFIDRMDGYISYKAMRMLSKNKINIHFQDYSGEIEYSMINRFTNNGKVRIAQLRAYDKRREKIALTIVDSKIRSQYDFLRTLKNRYHDVNPDYVCKSKGLGKEPEYASWYFSQLRKVFDSIAPTLEFQTRNTGIEKHNRNAKDPINAMLNFLYTVLYAKVLKSIHKNGLMPDISFVHLLSNKPSLIYDLVENVRWLADYSTIQALETGKIALSDFSVSNLNTIRLRPSAQSLALGFMQSNLNRYVMTAYGNLQYETLLDRNIRSFALSLTNNHPVKFDMPIHIGIEDSQIIDKLRDMGIAERKALGISKTTLFYIQRNLREGKPVKVYGKVRKKLTTDSKEILS